MFGMLLIFAAQMGDDEPRDITGPELVPPSPAHDEWWWFGLFPIIFIGVPLIVFLVTRNLTPKRRRTSPRDRALSQLDRLVGLQLLAKHEAERHFTLLSGILRRYLEKDVGVPAARLTTAEFLAAAERNSLLTSHLGFLTSFFSACDVAKFAPPAAIPEMGRDLEAELRTWLLAQSASKSSPSLDGAAAGSKMSDS